MQGNTLVYLLSLLQIQSVSSQSVGPLVCGSNKFCVQSTGATVNCYGSSGGCLWGSNDCIATADCVAKYGTGSPAFFTNGFPCSYYTSLCPGTWQCDACGLSFSRTPTLTPTQSPSPVLGPMVCGSNKFCVQLIGNRVYCFGSAVGCLWASNDCTSTATCLSKYTVSSPKYTDGSPCSSFVPGNWPYDACYLSYSQTPTLTPTQSPSSVMGPMVCGSNNFCVQLINNRIYCFGSTTGCLWASNDCTSTAACLSKYTASSIKFTDSVPCSSIGPAYWGYDACYLSWSQTQTLSQSMTSTRTQTFSGSQTFTCSSTVTPSVTPSVTLTRSQSQTTSLTSTQTSTSSSSPTPSQDITQSGTQSLTATQASTLSLSPSVSASIVGTGSQTSSQTKSRSLSASQTASGFPVQRVIDNTANLLNFVDAQLSSILAPTTCRGLVLFFPEADPNCGPGKYVLRNIRLALSAVSALTSANFEVSLYTTSNVTFQAEVLIVTAMVTVVGIPSSAGSFSALVLPSTFVVDTVVSQFYMVVWRPVTVQLEWHAVVGQDVPTAGLARAMAPTVSVDAGLTFAVDTSFGGIFINGQKLVCSPSSTPALSSSQTRTTTRSCSPTGSISFTATSTGTITQSQSSSQTTSTSITNSRTLSASATETVSPSCSRMASSSATASPSVSQSISSSTTMSTSRTASASATLTASPSPTYRRIATSSATELSSMLQSTSSSSTISSSQSIRASATETASPNSSYSSHVTSSSSMEPSTVSESVTRTRATSPSVSATQTSSQDQSSSRMQAGSDTATISLFRTGSQPQSSSTLPVSSSSVATGTAHPALSSMTPVASRGTSVTATASPSCTSSPSVSIRTPTACSRVGVPVTLELAGGISPTVLVSPTTGFLARLEIACYLGIPVSSVTMTAVVNSSYTIAVNVHDAVNLQDSGDCASLIVSRRSLDPAVGEFHNRHLEATSPTIVSLTAVVDTCATAADGSGMLSASLTSLLAGLNSAGATDGGNRTAPHFSAFLSAVSSASGVSRSAMSLVTSAGRPTNLRKEASDSSPSASNSTSILPIAVGGALGAILLLLAIAAVVICRRRNNVQSSVSRLSRQGGIENDIEATVGSNPMMQSPTNSGPRHKRQPCEEPPRATRRRTSIKTVFGQRYAQDTSHDASAGTVGMSENPMRKGGMQKPSTSPSLSSSSERIYPSIGAAGSPPATRRTPTIGVGGSIETGSLSLTHNPMMQSSRPRGGAPVGGISSASDSPHPKPQPSQLHMSLGAYGNRDCRMH